MKERFEIRLLDTQNATQAEWEGFHIFFKQIIEDNYPSTQVNAVEDTIKMNKEFLDSWRDEHHLIFDTEKDKIIGRIRYGYIEKSKDDCTVWIDILKEYQRQGLSTLLLEKLNVWMEKNERTRGGFWLNTPIPGYRKWIETVGGTEDMNLSVSRMYLNEVPTEYLDQTTAVIKNAPNLKTELWFNEFPEEYMDSFLRLIKDFYKTRPQGEEPDNHLYTTREFLLTRLEFWSKKGIDSYQLVAIDTNSNEVISFTQCLLNRSLNDRMHQLGTGTLTPYKKKGIGKALKSMMVELLKEKEPTVEYIFTANAENNPPMLHINQLMGFKKWYTARKYNLKKEVLEKHLENR